ncbi:unnamed protein product [Urochloa decumbens]|uniref:Agglutinin domain-containing protein n=1 Tax=Urochloa decumbens TaxID=240449 RepID=A0ABC9DAQ8_9POAL
MMRPHGKINVGQGTAPSRSQPDDVVFGPVTIEKQRPAKPAKIPPPERPKTQMAQKFELPKYVCFKGDNDKYLSVQSIEGHPYLQFSSDDIGDPSVKHTIYNNGDGYIRIRANKNNKFWRRSPNWIWADSDDTTSNDPDTLFRVVKLEGNIFALENHGNDHFCHRLTYEGKESCLNATIPSIRNEARLHIEEVVLSRRIYNIEYDLEKAKIYDSKALTMVKEEAINHGSKDTTATLNLKYEIKKEKKWNSSSSLKLGVTAKIEAAVPQVADLSVELSTESTKSYTWAESNSNTEERLSNTVVTVPPQSKVIVSVLATEATCDVPFSYYQEDILTDGQTVVRKFDDGIYRGVNSYGFKHDISEEKLENVSA